MPSVLIVEDNLELLDLFSFVLEWAGWSVETASDVETAVRSLSRRKPDLIVTDLAMPGQGGETLVTHARRLFAGQRLPIVIVSGQAERLLRETGDGTPLGACHVAAKPMTPDQLVAAVDATLHACGLNCPGAGNRNPMWRVVGCGLQ